MRIHNQPMTWLQFNLLYVIKDDYDDSLKFLSYMTIGKTGILKDFQ